MPLLKTCPTRTELAAFQLGELDEFASNYIVEHLETCTVCEQLAQEMDGLPDPVVQALQLTPSVKNTPEIYSDSTQLLKHSSSNTEVLPVPKQVGRYEITEEVGRGGMGVVYKAWDPQLKRPVAIKMVLHGIWSRGQERKRFQSESEMIARLHHPNIMQIHEVGMHDGLPYLALEWIEGGSLSQWLQQHKPTTNEAAALTARLATVMHYAHSQGIIHRDIKPANLLLSTASEADETTVELQEASVQILQGRHWILKVSDFGLAKAVDDKNELTESGQVMGTPSYLSPEQAKGSKLLGPPADIYSIGAILYQLLSGDPPFSGSSPIETVMQVINNEVTPLEKKKPGIPRDLATICERCLAKEPVKRYPSAAALAEDLRRYLQNEPIQARPVGKLERLQLWSRRKPALAAMAALVLFTTLIGTISSIIFGVSASQSAEDAVKQAGQAKSEKKQAEVARSEAQAYAATLLYAKGQQMAEAGMPVQGLFTMVDAWKQSPVDAKTFQSVVSLNLEAWLKQMPTMVWHQDGRDIGSSGSFSHDGTQIVSFPNNMQRRLATTTGNQLGPDQELKLQGQRIVGISPDESLYAAFGTLPGKQASVSGFRVLKSHDLQPAGPAIEIAGLTQDQFAKLTFTPDSDVVLISWLTKSDLSVKPFSISRGTPAGQAINLNIEDGYEAVVSEKGTLHLLVAEASGSFVWYDLKSGKQLIDSPEQLKYPLRIEARTGRLVIKNSIDTAIHIKGENNKANSWRPRRAYVGSANSISADGRLIPIGGTDQMLRLYQIDNQQPLLMSLPMGRQSAHAAFSPDGKSLLVQGSTGGSRLYQLGSQLLSLPREENAGSQYAPNKDAWDEAAYSPDRRTVVVVRKHLDHQSGQLIDLATGLPLGASLKGACLLPTFSRDGRWLALVTRNADEQSNMSVQVIDTKTGELRLPPISQPQFIHSLAISENGDELAVGLVAGCLIWNLKSGELIHQITQRGPLINLEFLQNDSRLVAVSRSGWNGTQPGFQIWDLEKNKPCHELVPSLHAPVLARYAREGIVDQVDLETGTWSRWSANGESQHKLIALERLRQANLRIERDSSRKQCSVIFSKDHRYLAGYASDDMVSVWEMATGRQLWNAGDHGEGISQLEFSQDGTWLAMGCVNRRVRLRHVQTGLPVGPWLVSEADIIGIAFSNDNKTLMMTDADGITQTWLLPEPHPGDVDQFQKRMETQLGMRQSPEGIVWTNRAEVTTNSLGVSHPNDSNSQTNWHALQSQQSMQRKQDRAALWHLDQWLKEEPAAWPALIRKAQVFSDRGDWITTKATLQIVLTVNHGSEGATWCLHRASQAAMNKHLDDALWYLDQAVLLSPDHWRTWSERAMLHLAANRKSLAESDYRQALKLGATDTNFLTKFAEHWALEKKWKDAAIALHRCNQQPSSPASLCFLEGLACLYAGNRPAYEQVCKATKLVFQQRKLSLVELNSLAMLASLTDQSMLENVSLIQNMQGALASVPQQVRIPPAMQNTMKAMRNTLGLLLWREGRCDEALKFFQVNIKSSGNDHVQDWLGVALVQHQLKQDPAAREAWQKCKSQEPSIKQLSVWEQAEYLWFQRSAKAIFE